MARKGHNSIVISVKPLFSVLFLLIVFLLPLQGNCAEELYVFCPTPMHTRFVKQKLSKACPKIEITVFGKFRDFHESIKKNPPNAILTTKQGLKNLDGFQPALTGTRKGKAYERFFFITVNDNFDSSELNGIPIGMVNFLGRSAMNSLISEKFSAKPKLKLVTKVEDLLPLLRFGMVKAVLVPEHFFDYFKETSNLKFSITPIKEMRYNMGVIAVYKGKPAGKIITEIKNLDAELSHMFGIEKWK